MRTARGWTQEQLAEQAGIHVTFVSGIECGRRICSLKRLARLAAALQTTPSDLLQERGGASVAADRPRVLYRPEWSSEERRAVQKAAQWLLRLAASK